MSSIASEWPCWAGTNQAFRCYVFLTSLQNLDRVGEHETVLQEFGRNGFSYLLLVAYLNFMVRLGDDLWNLAIGPFARHSILNDTCYISVIWKRTTDNHHKPTTRPCVSLFFLVSTKLLSLLEVSYQSLPFTSWFMTV